MQKDVQRGGICTFADWLCYYKNLDAAPGLEALEKMMAVYTEKNHLHPERRRQPPGGGGDGGI